MGAMRGLALLKFSTSPKKRGLKKIKIKNNIKEEVIIRVSFCMNVGENSILSEFSFVPNGFEEPVECSITK